MAEASRESAIEKRVTCCGCVQQCGLRLTLHDGRVTDVRGDADHPASQGYVCPKATDAPEIVYHAGRVHGPLKRVGARGAGAWPEISWQQAVREIALRIEAITTAHGAESLAYSNGTFRGGDWGIGERFLNRFGSPNSCGQDKICYGTLTLAKTLTYGYGPTVFSWPQPEITRCVVLWGMRPIASAPLLWRAISRTHRAGAKLIVIDPLHTQQAHRADQWLAPLPGSDAALGLALLKVIVEHAWHDAEFVREQCIGFDALCAHLATYDLPTLAVGCGLAVDDIVSGGGSPEWLASHGPAQATSPLVTTLLAAGADLIGKTVCDELFYSVAGENAHYGTPVNVRAAGRIAGGSSSGSAAAVAAGLCDFALGSDTGGSVRVPASLCGLFGLRPSHGRVCLDHALAMAPSFDTAGWFTRDAALCRDLGRLLLEGPAIDAPITRVLLASDAFEQADLSVQQALRVYIARQAQGLRDAQPITLAPAGLDTWRECLRICQGFEVWQQFGAWLESTRPRFGPGIRERMAMASHIDRASATAESAVRATLRAELDALIVPGTIVLLASAPCIAAMRNLDASADHHFRRRAMALTGVGAGIGRRYPALKAGRVRHV